MEILISPNLLDTEPNHVPVLEAVTAAVAIESPIKVTTTNTTKLTPLLFQTNIRV